MRLDVVEGRAGRLQEALERADLVDQEVAQLLALHLHLAAAEALAVGERRVRADLHAVRQREADGRVHDRRVRRMKAAGDIGDADEGHDPLIVAEGVEAVPLADVAVDGDRHGPLPAPRWRETLHGRHRPVKAVQTSRVVMGSTMLRRVMKRWKTRARHQRRNDRERAGRRKENHGRGPYGAEWRDREQSRREGLGVGAADEDDPEQQLVPAEQEGDDEGGADAGQRHRARNRRTRLTTPPPPLIADGDRIDDIEAGDVALEDQGHDHRRDD